MIHDAQALHQLGDRKESIDHVIIETTGDIAQDLGGFIYSCA